MSANNSQEQLWIEQAKQGEERAFYLLMGKFWEPLLIHLSKRVYDEADREDVCIIAFTKAFKNIEKYNDKYAFSTWLYQIANNTVTDFYRKSEKGVEHKSIDSESFFTTLGQYLECPNKDPEQLYILKQKIKEIMLFMDSMKPQYKKLIELRYFNDLKLKEISDELHLPLGTVKVNLGRARTILISSLAEKLK